MPTGLAAALAVLAFLAPAASIVLMPLWFVGMAIGMIVTTALLHRMLWRRTPAGWAVAVVLGVGALLALGGWRLESGSTEDDHLPTASISTPAEGAHVPYQVQVTGTSSGIPLESRPWLFVQSNDGDLYPQGGDHGNGVLIDRSDQSWCGYAYFGVPDRSSAGRSYVLIVALATHAAEQRLQREMQSFFQVPHWRSLPAGFEQLGDARVLTRLPRFQTRAQLEATKSCR